MIDMMIIPSKKDARITGMQWAIKSSVQIEIG